MRATERLLSRRRVLRGLMQGGAVTVALPFLNCFLNVNGTALADGSPRRVRFAHWFWGNGFTAGQAWAPEQTGMLKDIELTNEIRALEKVKTKINLISHLNVPQDGHANRPHTTGWQGAWQGMVPAGPRVAAPSVDTLISEQISKETRFRSLGASCTGNPASTVSYLEGGVAQPNEAQPASLYARIFGPEFTHPNAGRFSPDPKVMAKRSVLSAIEDERKAFEADLGAEDRQRIDQYFTSLRQLEQQVEMQLTKPEPLAACVRPKAPEEGKASDEIDVAISTHKIMGQLLAHALLCDQTRSVRMMFSDAAPRLRIPGDSTTYHTYSHQELISSPQEKCRYFANACSEQLADFIEMLDSFKEGDSTLLDQMLVVANTDNGMALVHGLNNIPMITAGRAGGLIKTGMHVNCNNGPATRLGLTAMQTFKAPINKFGANSLETTRPITEILA